MGTVRSLIEGPLNKGEDGLLVKDVVSNGVWSFTNLSFDLSSFIKKTIVSTSLRRFLVREDHRSWISNASGEFNPKNAYLIATREDLNKPEFGAKWIWKLCTLPKI